MRYLNVRVTPGARQDAVLGWLDGSGQPVLRLRVRAAAERGKANEAVRRLLAAALGLPLRQVTLARGAASREKLIQVEGLTEREVLSRLGGPIV